MYSEEEWPSLTVEELEREIQILNGQKSRLQREADKVDDTIVGLKEELRRKKIEEQEQSRP